MSELERGAEATAPPAEAVAAWASIDGLTYAFYGRHGGLSDGPWQSLNLSEKVGDDDDTVRRNWRRVAAAAGGLHIARMTQIHGSSVRAVGAGECAGECDGLLSRDAGLALAVLTADCVPILMVAPAHRAVMALHAGWRGTVAGIAVAGLEAGRRLGIEPADWQAALGPSIGGCCYEVSAEIGAELEDRWGAMADAWQPAGRRGQLDLRLANSRILVGHGVPESAVVAVGPCTACEHQRYFSHRRSGGRTGRQASLIGFR
jgi:polyphenol oxidase